MRPNEFCNPIYIGELYTSKDKLIAMPITHNTHSKTTSTNKYVYMIYVLFNRIN